MATRKTQPKKKTKARKVVRRAAPKPGRKPKLDPRRAAAIALALEAEDASSAAQTSARELPSGWQLSGRARRTHSR